MTNAIANRNFRLATFVAAFVLGAIVAAAQPTPAAAQSSRDMSVLTEEQRAEFNHRLQAATSSADRARITAELNRAIQQRKLELRRLEQQKQSGKK